MTRAKVVAPKRHVIRAATADRCSRDHS